MGVVGKVFKTSIKVVGTVAVGGVGVFAGALSCTKVPGASEGFKAVSDACFGTVGKIWDKQSDINDVTMELNNVGSSITEVSCVIDELNVAISNLDDLFDEKGFIKSEENIEYIRGVLIGLGKNPRLVNNPSFIKMLETKYKKDPEEPLYKIP